MTETRDAGLTPERVEALDRLENGLLAVARQLRTHAKDEDRIILPENSASVVEKGAATIAELRAEVESWKGQEYATSELCRERGEALERKDAALREAAEFLIYERCWACGLANPYRTGRDCTECGDRQVLVERLRALAPVADQTGETRTDTDRLDWLERTSQNVDEDDPDVWASWVSDAPTLREAIDAAMDAATEDQTGEAEVVLRIKIPDIPTEIVEKARQDFYRKLDLAKAQTEEAEREEANRRLSQEHFGDQTGGENDG